MKGRIFGPPRRAALAMVLLFLIVVFSVFVEGFLEWFNLFERTRYWVVTGMIAVPMTLIIATGGIDLSVGSMVALCGIVFGLLYRDAGFPIAAAACGAVVVGAMAGGLNGGVSSIVGVPPLVVTLATMALFRGVAMGLSKGAPIREFPPSLEWIAQGNLIEFGWRSGESVYIPAPLAALALTFAVGMLVLRKSWIGRYIECIGENETAARFAAIDVRRLKLGLYTACGAVCGCAALFQTALYSTAKADTGAGLELDAIACVVVGGTRISGGRATLLGTLLGLLIIGILRYGLEMAGVRSQYIIILMGLLVVATATLNERVAGLGERA